MNVTIVSTFRQAVAYIPRYFAQIDHLAILLARRTPYTRLNLLLGYGDSTDGTGEALFEAAADSIGAHLIDVSHGGPHFGSIEDAQRFRQLAQTGNKLWAAIPPDADVVALVESDLIWEAETMLRLIDHLHFCEVIAPMVMDGPESFYDVFAYRKDGVRFTKTPPYCADLNGKVLKVDSAGSVLFMRAGLARLVRFTEDEVVVGMCKQIYQYGGAIFVDPTLKVIHP